MANQPSPDIFLSYSRRNKDVMQRVVVFLRNKGFKVWVDNERLTPGTPIWEAEIESAIASAGVSVVLLSPDAKQSEWVRAEVEYAKKNNKRVYPVLVAGDVRTSVPLGLLSHQFADLRTDERQGLEDLAEAVTAYLASLSGSAQPSLQASDEGRIDRDTRMGSENSTQPLVSPQDEIRTSQQSVEQPVEGETGQSAWPQSVPEPVEASQKGGNRRPVLWISGVIVVCVLGACVVGAAMIIPGLRPPATPVQTEPPQATEVPQATDLPTEPPSVTDAPPAVDATEAPTLSAQDIISGNFSSDWPMENHDAARTGYNWTESYLRPPLRELWVKDLGDYSTDGVSVSGGRVAIDGQGPNNSNEVVMLDAATGDVLWTFTLTGGGRGSMSSTPAFGATNLFFGGQGDDNLYGLDIETGSVSWERSGFGDLYSSEIAVVGDTVYVADRAHGVAAFQAATGDPLWSDGAGAGDLPAAVGSNLVFGVLPDSTTMVALDSGSGAGVWDFPGVNANFTWIVADSDKLFANIQGNEIVALNLNDGAVLWRTSLDANDLYSRGAALMDNKLYIPIWKDNQGIGGIVALDADTGATLWNFASGSEGVVSVAAANGVLYAAGWSSSTLYALSPSDGSLLWSYPLGCTGGEIAVAHGVLFVTSCSKIYALTNQD